MQKAFSEANLMFESIRKSIQQRCETEISSLNFSCFPEIQFGSVQN